MYTTRISSMESVVVFLFVVPWMCTGHQIYESIVNLEKNS